MCKSMSAAAAQRTAGGDAGSAEVDAATTAAMADVGRHGKDSPGDEEFESVLTSTKGMVRKMQAVAESAIRSGDGRHNNDEDSRGGSEGERAFTGGAKGFARMMDAINSEAMKQVGGSPGVVITGVAGEAENNLNRCVPAHCHWCQNRSAAAAAAICDQ